MKIIRVIIFMAFVLALPGCKSKLDENGIYKFSQYPFTVKAPVGCIMDMKVLDKDDQDNVVDFVTGNGYWRPTGNYYLIVIDTPEDVKDQPSFINSIRPWFLDTFQPKESEFFKLELKLKKENQKEVNGDPALEVTFEGTSKIEGEEGMKALVVATAVLHPTFITVAALAIPYENATGGIPWKCYKDFVNSVTETT